MNFPLSDVEKTLNYLPENVVIILNDCNPQKTPLLLLFKKGMLKIRQGIESRCVACHRTFKKLKKPI